MIMMVVIETYLLVFLVMIGVQQFKDFFVIDLLIGIQIEFELVGILVGWLGFVVLMEPFSHYELISFQYSTQFIFFTLYHQFTPFDQSHPPMLYSPISSQRYNSHYSTTKYAPSSPHSPATASSPPPSPHSSQTHTSSHPFSPPFLLSTPLPSSPHYHPPSSHHPHITSYYQSHQGRDLFLSRSFIYFISQIRMISSLLVRGPGR